jgi:hypothetical protein
MTSEITFGDKIQTLRTLLTDFNWQEYWGVFIDKNRLGIDLSYAVYENLIAELTDEGKAEVEGTFDNYLDYVKDDEEAYLETFREDIFK